MRALQYFFGEAAESLWRNRRAALLSMLTIAAGLFVLGFFLMVNANIQRIVGRWSDAAELAVYLRDDATAGAGRDDQRDADARAGSSASVQFVSKDEARAAVRARLPGSRARGRRALERNPFPASFDVRLNASAQAASERGRQHGDVAERRRAAWRTCATTGRWLARLNAHRPRRSAASGWSSSLLLAIASALTVANVVRLAALARRDEIEIMQLVGAPFAYIRGPFIAEGLHPGGHGGDPRGRAAPGRRSRPSGPGSAPSWPMRSG